MAHVCFYLICEVMEHRGQNVFNGGGESPRVPVELELAHKCEMIAVGFGLEQLHLLEA